MDYFLKKVAHNLLDKHQDHLEEISVIVPSKRSSLFLFKYLSEIQQKTFIAPKTLTWKDFLEKHTGFTQIDNLSLTFILYQAYLNVNSEAESFEEFSRWSSIILSDFNEIDNYNLNAGKVYQNLKNIKDLDDFEHWSFHNEELSEMQESYNSFYLILGELYKEFNRLLDEKKLGYPGKLKRLAKANNNIVKDQGYTYWIGFYAIAPSEQLIIDTFLAESKGYVYWDADDYYIDNTKNLAGDFFRKSIERKKKKYNWVESKINKPKNIYAHAVSGRVYQCSVADQILKDLDQENAALILADEDLLVPALENISMEQEDFNISIQISLDKSPFILLIFSFIEMQEKIRKENSGNDFKFIYYQKYIFQILNNPIINYDEKSQKIHQPEQTYYTWEQLKTFLATSGFEGLIGAFSPAIGIKALLESLEKLLDYCRYKINKDQRDPFYIEMLIQSGMFMKKLMNYCDSFDYIQNPTILKRIIHQLSREQKLDFFGEPLKGLQVIGLLESRALDFKNIVLLGCNEGVLPDNKLRPSFIPYDLRIDFNLPTQKEYESIFAYYFYRLLHHAENIHLVYNSKVGALGASEKSRFISQLEFEHKFDRFRSKIHHIKHTTGSNSELVGNIEIPKDGKSRELIQQKFLPKISASSINKYLRCSADFYFGKLQGLSVPKKLEEHIEQSTYGNIIHGILENLYLPFVGGPAIKKDDLSPLLDKIEQEYQKVLIKENLVRSMESSLNILAKDAIFEAVQNQIKRDQFLAAKHKLEIISLEESLGCNVQLGKHEVGLKGKIDRIDRLDDVVRIIDYKSGNVNPTDLSLKTISEDDLRKKDKLIQLLFYKLLYGEHSKGKHCVPGMYSTRNSKPSPINGKIQGEELNEDSVAFFKTFLENLIDEMLLGSEAFMHNEDSKYCDFCFKK